MKSLTPLLLCSLFLFLLLVSALPPAAGTGETDLSVSRDDIYVSRSNPEPGEDVVLHAVIRNTGEKASAIVRFFIAEIDEPLGEDMVTVDSGGSAVASVVFQPVLGPTDILVSCEVMESQDMDMGNNQAVASFEFYSGQSSLELKSAEATFEYGIERVIPIKVQSMYDLKDVSLSVIYHGDVVVEILSPPLDLTAHETATFFIRVRVPHLRDGEVLSNRTVLLSASNMEHSSNLAQLRIKMHPSVEKSKWWSPTVAVAAGTAGVFAAVGSTEVGKYKFLTFVGPLYTKLHREEVLDHYIRGKIHGYILANPGEHYNSIRKALDIPNGSFTYHLQVLEREGLIKSIRDGLYKRFYPGGATISSYETRPRISDTQQIIIANIRESPGISQKEIARILGASSSTINYHMNKLSKKGIVKIERRGMSVRYFLYESDEEQELVHFIKVASCQ